MVWIVNRRRRSNPMGMTTNRPNVSSVKITGLTAFLKLETIKKKPNLVSIIDPEFSLSTVQDDETGTLKVTETSAAQTQIEQGKYTIQSGGTIQGQTIGGTGGTTNMNFGGEEEFTIDSTSERKLLVGTRITVYADS